MRFKIIAQKYKKYSLHVIEYTGKMRIFVKTKSEQMKNEKEIYLAGVCFWGAEHFLKQIQGVTYTEVGYANGNVPDPTYQQVYTDTTGYAETVHVKYDPEVISLRFLLHLYFKAIDPISLNKQGEDIGTRYRTGIYFTDVQDVPVIKEVYQEVADIYNTPLTVEFSPLKNFYTAEEYHQDYLDKNPTGYCHLNPELFKMARKAKMRKILFLMMSVFALTLNAQNSVYDFKVADLEENTVSMDAYKGKVLLIVNTATKCGFTPQYKELQEIYEKYHAQGFEVLDFPCNQFGEQAPGSNEEIHKFCTDNYETTFPQFSKIDVNGENELPLYSFLKQEKGFEGLPDGPHVDVLKNMFAQADPEWESKPDIKWNFTKFVVDREGNVVARFEPTADMADVEKCVSSLL